MTNVEFSGKKAYEFLEEIHFPRRTGSDGNIEAIEKITKKLEKLGYEVKKDKFAYIHSYIRELLLIKVSITIFFSLMVMLSLFAYWSSPITRIMFLILSIISAAIQMALMIFNFNSRFNKYLNEKFSEKLPENEEIELPDAFNIIIQKIPKKSSKKHIIIGAHYDSISISYHYIVYALIFIISALGSIILGIYYIILDVLLINLINTPIFDLLVIIGLIFSSIVTLSLLMWLGLRLKNESSGASDNASGVSIIIELARILKDVELNYKLTLILFGVEEEGLLGSINYVKNNLDQLKSEDVMMISLDTLGTKARLNLASGHGIPKKQYDKELLSKLKQAADALDIDLKYQWLPYPSSDHAPFIFQNFKATQLFRKLTIANTTQDTIDKIDAESLEETGKLILKFLLESND